MREVNEDSFLVAPPVFVVADGMGGHAGGDVASRIVVEEFARLADGGYDPRRGAEPSPRPSRARQARILEYADAQRRSGRPRLARRHHRRRRRCWSRTTAAPKWLLANLGDSRIYRFTDGVLDQVSVDHSVVQELIDAGTITREEAATHPERHVITRALGGPEARRARLLPAAAAARPSGCCCAPTASAG